MIKHIARLVIASLFVWVVELPCYAADKPIQGLIPKAHQQIKIDGSLDDWQGAFITPLNAFHPDFFNRAALIYFLWDDQALYIGKRALDRNPTHTANDKALYDGDAIEFYLDTREGAELGNPEFKPRTLHMFFTALTGHELKPRYGLRQLDVFKDLKLKGVEMAAAKTKTGYTLEFKLPWSNFPGFTPKAGTPLGVDVELCSSDGAKRVHRTFTYSSPQSVQTPAAFGRVLLVDKLDPEDVMAYNKALMPMDVQVPGNYAWLHVYGCISPTLAKNVKMLTARLFDADEKARKSVQTGEIKWVAEHFPMVRIDMEIFDVPPGTYTLLVTGYNGEGKAITGRRLKVQLPLQP